MRLKRLYIKDYKILHDFTLDFPYDLNKDISIFIGPNGSGKSTLLEAIAQIFSSVFLDEPSKFGFDLEYSLKSVDVLSQTSNPIEPSYYCPVIKLFAEKDKKIQFSLNNRDTTAKNIQTHLPDNIIIYYSGLSDIMEKLCKPHEEILSKAYRNGSIITDRHFFYYKPEHFGIILISLLSFEFGEIPEFLKQKANIKGMQKVQIRLKKPAWFKDSIDKFWGAEGEVRHFLDYLKENSIALPDSLNIAKVNNREGITYENSHNEEVIITIHGHRKLFEVREHLIEERKLFELLNIMHTDGLLDDISFYLLKGKDTDSTTFQVLSEGEQQAITIKGLTELLSENNTLFLFDEPDTYMHPGWQRKFINEIELTLMQNAEIGHSFLITTHSPQLLVNASPQLNYVRIMENGKLIDETPNFYGREISSILYNLMGVEERNDTIKKDLSNLFRLIEEEEITVAEKEMLRLAEILGITDPDIQNAKIQISYLKEDEADNQK